MAIDKSERYLKDIAKNTAEIAKELKRIGRNTEKSTITISPIEDPVIYEKLSRVSQNKE